MWMALLIRAVVIVVVASALRYIIGRAPESVINAEFKGVLNWGILLVALVLLVVMLLKAVGA